MKPRLLLLEDDIGLQETISEALVESGYEVDAYYDGIDAQDALYEKSFDLLILDVNVPHLDGFTLLKQARQEGKTVPAIFITAKNALEDLEVGFQSGCDDYLRKPFALKELLLRVSTLLKRDFFHPDTYKVTIASSLPHTITYDTQSHLLYIDGQLHPLQDKTHRLLALFLRHPNRTLSHEEIYAALWEFDETPSDLSLRTYIKELRHLLGKEKIVSIKRQGYLFSAQ